MNKNYKLSDEKITAIKELHQTEIELKKERKKKRIKTIIILFVFILIIKIFFGTLEIKNLFGYNPSKARYYKVTINNKQIPISYTAKHKLTIIPYLINFNTYYYGNNYIEGNSDGIYKVDKDINIDINSFKCYTNDGKYQIECTKNTLFMKPNNDTKYTKLTITRTSNPYGVIYDGKYINDISSYITKKGSYHIEITAEYENMETKIDFPIQKNN